MPAPPPDAPPPPPRDAVCAALRAAGLAVAPGDVRLEPREERWLARLPGGALLAWYATSDAGRARLARERRLLRVLAARCAFRAPRVRYESPDGSLDLREMVGGACEPFAVYRRACADPALAARIGREVGAILAEQHTRVAAADVDGWLPRVPSWPEPADVMRPRLARVVADRDLLRAIDAVLAAGEALAVDESERALVHADVGFHNLAFDPDTLAVRGIFDYDDAAWADRHHDFRYLLFDRDRSELLDAALAVYEPATGRVLSRARVALYNALCAVSYLAYREGTAPEVRSCGRTLAEDLGWTRHAVARARRDL